LALGPVNVELKCLAAGPFRPGSRPKATLKPRVGQMHTPAPSPNHVPDWQY